MLNRFLRTFEFDDYPRDLTRFLEMADWMKRRWPDFKCTVFAIPEEMDRRAWRAAWRREDWLHVCPHGFIHDKRECREPLHYERRLRVLDRMARKDKWKKLFKAPWYGYDEKFLGMLAERGFAFCAKTLKGFPFPMPKRWRMWNITDAEFAIRPHLPETHWLGVHVDSHPVYGAQSRARIKASATEISTKNIFRWVRHWRPNDRWAFVEDLVRPALLKLNLGCGPHVWNGWACLDPRSHLDSRIIEWDFTRQIPFGDNKADLVLTSHVFNYIEEEKYVEALLDIWRVLRPGGVLRMQEDRTDNGYIWKAPGAKRTRGTGVIRSLPTRDKIFNALHTIGFEVHHAEPGKTLSPHKDVIRGDTRKSRYRCGHKFYVEAVKRLPEWFDVARPRFVDRRATRKGRYQLPEPIENVEPVESD